MHNKTFLVILTNGTVEQSYLEHAGCEEAAIILAQADAIQMGRGYKFVSIL